MSAFDLIVVGASWGGFAAVATLLAGLPAQLGPAVAIALHRPPEGGEGLPGALARRAGREVCEPHDKEPLEPGRVYLAPADYHLLVEPGHFALSVDEPVRFSRPSIDVLFVSAADAYRERMIAVVLTGAGDDGAAGMAHVKRCGGLTVAQDPATAERPEMPNAAVAAGAADEVLPLDGIATFLTEVCTA